MSAKPIIPIVLAILTASVSVQAETQRARLTTENKFPGLQQWEGGAELRFIEGEDEEERIRTTDFNLTSLVPYVRYGFREQMALEAELPISHFNPDAADDEIGIGDLRIGMELRAFEDIFSYPYIIPHAHAEFSTGDEDKNLGLGDNTLHLGVTVGQKWGKPMASSHGDHFTFAGDLTYSVRSDNENELVGGVSFIWDLAGNFALIGEASASTATFNDRDHPILFQGGMAYDWSDDLHFAVYGGGFQEAPEDVIAIFKTAYNF